MADTKTERRRRTGLGRLAPLLPQATGLIQLGRSRAELPSFPARKAILLLTYFPTLLVGGCAGSDGEMLATGGDGGTMATGSGASPPVGGAPTNGTGGGSGATASSGGVVNSSGGAAGGTAGPGETGGTGGASAGGHSGDGGAGGLVNAGGSGAASGSGNTAGSGGVPSETGGSGGQPVPTNVTIYIAGDSTVSTYADTPSPDDQAGWGQMLHEIFTPQVTVENRAAGGRTAQWFYLEGAVQQVLDRIQPGDYFFIQFGTNDSNKTATFTVDGVTYPRYADPSAEFQTYLKDYYITPTRELGATPVLVTPPPRNSAYCGTGNSLAGHSDGMRELALAEDVLLLDLNEMTFGHLAAICPSPTPEDFFLLRTDGTVDGTHFQEHGARTMAGFLGKAIRQQHLPLESLLLP